MTMQLISDSQDANPDGWVLESSHEAVTMKSLLIHDKLCHFLAQNLQGLLKPKIINTSH